MTPMQTSGVVLDIYDDVGGEVLRSMWPTKDAVPDLVKTAHALSADERSRLPDDAFALVLVNGEEKLRKFACIDEGNTTLSVLYFLKHAHKLPDVARARAAENLKVACAWYDLDVPEELEKEAGLVGKAIGAVASAPGRAAGWAAKKTVGAAADHALKNPVGTAMTAMTLPSIVKGTKQSIGQNLQKVRAGEQMAGTRGGLAAMAGPHELAHLAKHGEATGTSCMPISVDSTKKTSAPPATVRKTAHMNPIVDVTGLQPTKTATVVRPSRYALGTTYPLDTYEQVKMAAAYFDENGRRLTPADRHEYCTNLVKRASELDIPLSDIIRTYGSEKYASDETLRAAIESRRQIVDHLDKEASVLLEEIYETRHAMPPEDYATVLEAFDKTAGIAHLYDAHVMDPFYSTFGFEKTAEGDDFKDSILNFHVTGADLKRLALTPKNLEAVFGDDFVEEFRKDPISIYKSMPVEQKKLIIRMATENSPA